MALADPQSVTIAGSTSSLPKTGFNPSQYTDSTGMIQIQVRQEPTSSGRKRITVDLKQTKIVADPVTGLNRKVSSTTRVLSDTPSDNTYSPTDRKNLLIALVKWFNADGASPTYVNTDKVFGGES